jgi:hypothetical protein
MAWVHLPGATGWDTTRVAALVTIREATILRKWIMFWNSVPDVELGCHYMVFSIHSRCHSGSKFVHGPLPAI